MLAFTPATRQDAEELAGALRDQDRAELAAAGRLDALETILQSIEASDWAVTTRVDGRLASIGGVAPGGTLLTRYGVPWMLGTDEVPRHRRALVTHAPVYIARMRREYPELRNLVHAENTVAVAWLRRVGFRVHEVPMSHPATGAPFLFFSMPGNHV